MHIMCGNQILQDYYDKLTILLISCQATCCIGQVRLGRLVRNYYFFFFFEYIEWCLYIHLYTQYTWGGTILEWGISPSGHCWNHRPGTPSILSSHCNSLQERVPVDEIYGYPILKRVAVTWHEDRVPGHQFQQWPPGGMTQWLYSH